VALENRFVYGMRMAGLGRDPSPNELLKRIVELENKVSSLQRKLDKHIDDKLSPLKAQIADLFEASKYQADATADHVMTINAFLVPLVHKVFPQYSKTKSMLDAIVPPGPADPRADRRRKRKSE
jgi:hypothetical protein